MKTVGYIQGVETILCPDCINNPQEADPIFEDSAWDTPVHCEECETLIEVELTEEGKHYVKTSIIDFLVASMGRKVILRQWVEYYGNLYDLNIWVVKDGTTNYFTEVYEAYDYIHGGEEPNNYSFKEVGIAEALSNSLSKET